MTCINRLSNLGCSPYQYLVSSQKEKTLGAAVCKTSLAIALLVPGILVALGCSLANVLLSPCLKTKSISQKPLAEKEPSSLHVDSKKGEAKTLSQESQLPLEGLFEAERKLLRRELAEICVKSVLLVALEDRQYCSALPEEFLKSLGRTRPCSSELDRALRPLVFDEYIPNKKTSEKDWAHFQDVSRNTNLFLDAYEKALDLYQVDLVGNFRFQRWHKNLCTTTIEAWTHAKNITQLMGQEEMEKLADQALVRWKALLVKDELPKVSKKEFNEEPADSSSEDEIAENGSSNEQLKVSDAFSSPRKSVDLSVDPSGENLRGVEAEKEPAEVYIPKMRQEDEFRALGMKLEEELSEVNRWVLSQLFFLEGKGYYEALPEEIFKSLGRVRPCSRHLNAALWHLTDAHNANKKTSKEDWNYFQSICEAMAQFLDAYEKVVDRYKFDPAAQVKFQSWHEKLCTATIEVWTHVKNITQLMGQAEMEKLAHQILARWEVVSAKKMVVSAFSDL